MSSYLVLIKPSIEMNNIRWNKNADGDAELQYLVDFLDKRVAALNKGFSSNSALLYYNLTTGSGCIFNNEILSIDDTVKLASQTKDVIPPNPSDRLVGWNTEPDLSGTRYKIGEEIKLTEEVTVLYAEWGSVTSKSSWFYVPIIVGASALFVILVIFAIVYKKKINKTDSSIQLTYD